MNRLDRMDEYCRFVIGGCRNMLVPWWMMACWAYEEGPFPLISDALFDQIARDLDVEWDSVQHRHKQLVCRADLKGRLGFIGDRWPTIGICAAMHLIKEGPPARDKWPAFSLTATAQQGELFA